MAESAEKKCRETCSEEGYDIQKFQLVHDVFIVNS